MNDICSTNQSEVACMKTRLRSEDQDVERWRHAAWVHAVSSARTRSSRPKYWSGK